MLDTGLTPDATPAEIEARYNALAQTIAGMKARHRQVPAEYRRALEELNAELVDAHFNNLPV